MIKKRKIVLASILKPVDDPRMYEKFALSMGQTNKYEVNIIGFAVKNIPRQPNIHFHPLFNFRRLSWKRLTAPLKYWQKLLEVKPELIIVTTPDLLIVSCVYKILFGSKVIYDVQENYKANIIWSSSFPFAIKQTLALTVRTKEYLTKRMIVHFLLAEKCYLNECPFIPDSFTIIENKALQPTLLHLNRRSTALVTTAKESQPIKLVYTGTIAESYGIFDCLDLLDYWLAEGAKIHLTIAGYCPRKDTLTRLLGRIEGNSSVTLVGGNEIVPHHLILEELQKTDYALISYRLNPSNQDCMPTRIWECLAYNVPMLMKHDHPWVPMMNEYRAGIALDFNAPPPFYHLPGKENSFYSTPIPDSFYWEHEAKKLLKSLDALF